MIRMVHSSATPLHSIPNSWDRVSVCKHFCPCDGLSSGNLVDVKGGVIMQPQYDDLADPANPIAYAFSYDADRYAVASNAPASAPRRALASGSWATHTTGKAMLFLQAGYVDLSLDTTMRIAIGDSNTAGGWGMADGGGGTNVVGHVLVTNSGDVSSYSRMPDATTPSLAQQIGDGTHFFRYSLYRPDGLLHESRVYNVDTGALIAQNTVAQSVGVLSAFAPDAKFRMAGTWNTGFALFYFDSADAPSDYLLAMHTMAREWGRGNKVIWPYWD